MDARKFFDLVAEMRSAQKEYFALRKRRLMSMHRYLFRRKNYIVERGSNDVYYDEDTQRNPKMEANAHKYGLRVMPLNLELRTL